MSQNAMDNSLTLIDLTKFLGKLTSTVQPVLPAKLQIRFLQQIQIQTLRKNMTYESVITLDEQAKAVMVDNQHENLQGKSLLIVTPGPYHIFRCIDERLMYFKSRDYQGGR